MSTLSVPGATLAYDVRHVPGDRVPLLMVGQPMTADGFTALAELFTDRTVIRYDPRGLGRSERTDGRTDNTPQQQAADLHRLIDHLALAPVDVFASSGGAVTALELVATHPYDVRTLVAHEPPINAVLPDAAGAARARAHFHEAYLAGGRDAGMAAFMAMTQWPGEFTDEYFAQLPPLPPASLSSPGDDPLLSQASWPITDYQPDPARLTGVPTRIVIAVGEETGNTYTGRTTHGVAALLGLTPTVFPSHHGGFLPGHGQPDKFAAALRSILD
ncbi:alpha/beta fold hydrolase [Symbioplanes lichenis]|uniref:alpha/beta fold hydrolase n=1 Tax=Symbioplanes lichenis TaxID=1629072 RepID=UPI00273940D2|nr:alpha/beta hydrolase [Actinoplanes lichenis]